MYKNILKSFRAAVILPLFLVACNSSDDDEAFTSQVIMADGVSIEGDKASTQLWFSTDGTNYANFLNAKVGEKYKVKLYNLAEEEFIGDANGFQVDWSQSNPKPDNATSDNPEFTLTSNNSIIAVIDDKHCEFDHASWLGDWIGEEGSIKDNGVTLGNGSDDAVTITSDPANATNGFIFNNAFGYGAAETMKVTFVTSTTAHDQQIVVESQSTVHGDPVSGTGFYDQCNGTFFINMSWTEGADVYTWTYVFTKDE